MIFNVETFWKNVRKTDYCWEYIKRIDTKGYGRIQIYGKKQDLRAHRASWMLHNGKIPPNTFVCHKCDNPCCIRPDHLFLGSPKDNIRDMMLKGRQAPSHKTAHFGEDNAASKITSMIAQIIRAKYKTDLYSQQQLADQYGINQRSVSNIILHKTWKET